MELRRVAPVLGLCALLAADAVLIAWAFRGTPVEDPASASTDRPSASSSAPSPTAPPAPKPVPVERMVTAVDAAVAWVVQAGSCTAPGTVWVTDDTGATWESREAPGRVLRARPGSAAEGFVTGGDDGCDLRLWNTGDGGRTWSEPKSAADAWSRVPNDAKAVHTPDDVVTRPCGTARVIDLVGVSGERATAMCENGNARATTDRGASWVTAFTLPGALAIGALENGSGVVVRTVDSCRGVVAVPLVAGKPEGKGRCVPGSATSGEVSVSGTPVGWWLLVGERAHTAKGPGGPWTRTRAALEG